jgi:hypothetical protein
MKDVLYYKTSMHGFVAVTRALDLSWVRHTNRGSFSSMLLQIGALETRAITSTTDHTYYLAFLHMRAGFSRSVQES